jgi:predicted protein tyrosine phosphatase
MIILAAINASHALAVVVVVVVVERFESSRILNRKNLSWAWNICVLKQKKKIRLTTTSTATTRPKSLLCIAVLQGLRLHKMFKNNKKKRKKKKEK